MKHAGSLTVLLVHLLVSLGCVVRPDAKLPPWEKTPQAALWLPPEEERKTLIFRKNSGGALPTTRPARLYLRPLSVDFSGCRGRNCELLRGQVASLPAWVWEPRNESGIQLVSKEEDADWVLESQMALFNVRVFWAFSHFDLIPKRECRSEVWFRIVDRGTGKRLWWCISSQFSAFPVGRGPEMLELTEHMGAHGERLRTDLEKALRGSPGYPGKP